MANDSYEGLSFPDWKEVVGTSPVLRNKHRWCEALRRSSRGPRPLCSLLLLCVGFVALRRSESSLCRYDQATAGCTKEGEARSISQRPSGRMSVSDGRAAQVRMVRQYTSPRSSHSKAHLAGLFAARCLLRAQRVGLRLKLGSVRDAHPKLLCLV